jgi:hypothetical protein
MPKRTTRLATAAACLTAIMTIPSHAQMRGTHTSTAGDHSQQFYIAQADEGDVTPSRSARQNVIESREYDRALETNRAFREARMRKECGPITDQQLRQSCLESFRQDEPTAGSSRSRRGARSDPSR